MITMLRTQVALPGKLFELLAAAKADAAMIKKLGGPDFVIGSVVGGVVGEVMASTHYDSLARYEETMTKLMANQELVAQLARTQALTVHGASRDHVWRHV